MWPSETCPVFSGPSMNFGPDPLTPLEKVGQIPAWPSRLTPFSCQCSTEYPWYFVVLLSVIPLLLIFSFFKMHSFEPPSSHYVYIYIYIYFHNIREIWGTPDLAHKTSMQNVPPLKSLCLWMLGTKGVCITRGRSLKQHLQKVKAA